MSKNILINKEQGILFTVQDHKIVCLFSGNLTQRKRIKIAEAVRPIFEWVTGVEFTNPIEQDAKLVDVIGIRESEITVYAEEDTTSIVGNGFGSHGLPDNTVHLLRV